MMNFKSNTLSDFLFEIVLYDHYISNSNKNQVFDFQG